MCDPNLLRWHSTIPIWVVGYGGPQGVEGPGAGAAAGVLNVQTDDQPLCVSPSVAYDRQ
jgi:hypothetical protein